MAQPLKDMELKEKLEKEAFSKILRQWADAIDGNRDVTVTVRGERCTIPATAFEKAKREVEYEIDGGEYEFQLTMKWRDS